MAALPPFLAGESFAALAKRLGTGLQNLLDWFDSSTQLHSLRLFNDPGFSREVSSSIRAHEIGPQ